MIAALLAVFAGAASAQTDTGKGQITAVNGIIGSTVSVLADDGNGTAYDLGVNLGDAGIGTPTTVEPGDYTITFNDGTSDIASYQLTVPPLSAWNIVSGYGDPAISEADNATAYPVNLDETRPAVVVFANSSAVTVTVDPNVGEIPQGYQNGFWTPDSYVITTPGGGSTTADLAGLPDTSYTDVIAVGDDATINAAIVTIGDLAALRASLEPGIGQVAVPDVVGQTEADANTAITGAGLVAAKTEAADDTILPGIVISQNPAGGVQVADGSAVNIVVSTGPDVTTVVVPDVSGKTAADAQTDLETAGFTVAIEEQASDAVEAGHVIGTNPVAGTEVAPDTTVVIIVSTGMGDAVVPDLSGMTVDDATKAAEEAGLTITFIEDADNPDPEGIVVSQDPTGGTTVEAGTVVVARLSPAVDEASVIITLDPNRLLTASGINFLPGSTAHLIVVHTGTAAVGAVQDDGSWTATVDLTEVQGEAELLLVTGTAADGSDYEVVFEIPAQEESSGISVWLWIVVGLVVVGMIALGIKVLGGDSTDGDDIPVAGTPTTGGPATGGDTPTSSSS